MTWLYLVPVLKMSGAMPALPLYAFMPCLRTTILLLFYRGADKSLARPSSRCIFFYGENILFDASLVYNTNIPPIMIINRIYETQNLLSL